MSMNTTNNPTPNNTNSSSGIGSWLMIIVVGLIAWGAYTYYHSEQNGGSTQSVGNTLATAKATVMHNPNDVTVPGSSLPNLQ